MHLRVIPLISRPCAQARGVTRALGAKCRRAYRAPGSAQSPVFPSVAALATDHKQSLALEQMRERFALRSRQNIEILGIQPDTPRPYWGWGDIPDQYRRRPDGDDGESPPPGTRG
jgi:hypothetical protein